MYRAGKYGIFIINARGNMNILPLYNFWLFCLVAPEIQLHRAMISIFSFSRQMITDFRLEEMAYKCLVS